jgi:hypothetical protein
MKTRARSLPALRREHPEIVGDIEQDYDRSWWVWLRPGWINTDLGAHFIHEFAARDALAAFASVERCDCEECPYWSLTVGQIRAREAEHHLLGPVRATRARF